MILTILALYSSVLAKLASDWWVDQNYSHGLLVPFVIGVILWGFRDRLVKFAASPSIFMGWALTIAGALLLLAGTLGAELFTQRISLVVLTVGIVIYFFGHRILPFLCVPILLFLLAVPIPQIIFNRIAFPLQLWASQMAVTGIRLFDIPVVRNGNVIDILPKGATQVLSLEVVEACSGIRSLMTLVTIGLLLGYFTRTNMPRIENSTKVMSGYDSVRTVLLMILALPIAVITNAGRVTATGILTFYYGKAAVDSLWHDASGWLVYVLALAILLAANEVLKRVFLKTGGSV